MAPSLCRFVPEITIWATLVAPGSLTAHAPVSVANGEIELSPVQPWQLAQAPSNTILPRASAVPPPSRCDAGAGGASVAGRSGVAIGAMRQRLREIGAPIPLRALRGIGLKPRIRIEQRRPEAHRPALVERKRQRIVGVRRAHRRQAEQIGLDRQSVGVCHIGVGRKRLRRITPSTVFADAAMDSVEEILIAVIADAGLLVRRDVG